MLKDILVVLDGSDYSWSALGHAIELARCFQATVHGMIITIGKLIDKQTFDKFRMGFEHVDVEFAQLKEGLVLMEQFEQRCSSGSVRFNWFTTDSTHAKSIWDKALEIGADIMIVGKHGKEEIAPYPSKVLSVDKIVRQAKLPIMLSQRAYQPIETAYLAYDGAIISIRALRFIAEICSRCKWKMKVLCVHRSPFRRDKLLEQASETAELHGVSIEKIGRGGDVVRQLLEVTAENPNALIVMGAYSKKLKELIIGSVPERIMHLAPQPILIYRPNQ